MKNEKQNEERENFKELNELIGSQDIYIHSKYKNLLKNIVPMRIRYVYNPVLKKHERDYSIPNPKLKKCVVAYTKNSLGSVFIIKGMKGYYGFVFYNELGQTNLAYGFNCSRISIDQALKTIEQSKDEKFILEEHITLIKSQEVLNQLVR